MSGPIYVTNRSDNPLGPLPSICAVPEPATWMVLHRAGRCRLTRKAVPRRVACQQPRVLRFITPVICYDPAMQRVQTKLTSQGQVSVPAAVRSFLHLMPGSVLVWSQVGDRIVVERAKRHSTAEVHRALFAGGAPVRIPAKTLKELKQGIRQRMQRRHAVG